MNARKNGISTIGSLLIIHFTEMFRPPPKLRGSSAETIWQNKMRDVVTSLRPIISRNAKISHTTRGVVHEGSALEETTGAASGGSAVWL